jgi:hypothetical protein
MRKLLAILKEMVKGGVSIDLIDKTSISRTPGNVTDMGHN